MAISEEAAAHYDNTLEPMEKKYLPSQEEFYIMSHSFVEEQKMGFEIGGINHESAYYSLD